MSLRNKLAIVGLSGVLFTGAAVGLSGIASAQGPEVKAETTSAAATKADVGVTETDAIELDEFFGDEASMVEAFEISPEDEALFEEYDQCLANNGFEPSVFEAEMDFDEESGVAVQVFEIGEDYEAAFEACDPILEDLSDDMVMMGDLGDLGHVECWVGEAELGDMTDFELTPEEEAMLEELEAGIESGDFTSFGVLVDENGDLNALSEGDWEEGDWTEAEEFFGDEGNVEYFEISPEDEMFLDGIEGLEDLEGCDGAVALSIDGEVEAATSDA